MPSAEQIQVLNEGATEILDDLSELSKDLPGVQARLESIAQHLNHAYSIAHDREYDILFPDTKRDAATRKENEEKQRAPVSDLAAEYAKQDPATVMRRVMALTKQADIANHSWPHHTHLLASDIAAQASNLTDWAKAAMAELEDPYFASPFLLALQEEDPEAARPILHQALKHDQHKYCAGDVILSRSFTDDDLWQAVQPILANFGMTARVLVIRNQMDTETVRHLLESGCDEVALPVATALSWSFREGTIDNDLLPIWEKALINAKLTDDYNLDNQITEALELHPATIMKWLRAKLREEPNPETMFDGLSHVAHDLIKVLTRDQRLELIRELPANYRAERIVRNLIDGDLGLFKELLANPNTRGYQLIPLSQVSGDSWIGFAEVAFSANWDEDDVLTASRKLDDSWSGPASDHYKGLMGLAALGTHATDPRIVSISNKLVEMYKVLYEGALRREKREDVYGFDD